jgi:hypothetical protein
MIIIEMQEDSSVALPFGCLVTWIFQKYVANIPSYEPKDTPEGAFSKKTRMKSDARLQRYWV